nr:hypothetical protein CFP56_33797 [Quercus suber]
MLLLALHPAGPCPSTIRPHAARKEKRQRSSTTTMRVVDGDLQKFDAGCGEDLGDFFCEVSLTPARSAEPVDLQYVA